MMLDGMADVKIDYLKDLEPLGYKLVDGVLTVVNEDIIHGKGSIINALNN